MIVQDTPEKTDGAVLLTYAKVRQIIIDILPEPIDFKDDDNLMELGIDSLRLIKLVNDFRQLGADVTFADLIKAPMFNSWLLLLNITK